MSDTAFDRDLIRSARLQFSPTTQSVKATAIDRIVEQSIGLSGEDGLTVEGIVQNSTVAAGGKSEVPVVRRADVFVSVRRLSEAGRVCFISPDSNTYGLTDHARMELEDTRRESRNRVERIVTHLFQDKLPEPTKMIGPFFELLGRVFSRLGVSYVAALKGDTSSVNPTTNSELLSAVSTVADTHNLEEELLQSAAIRFFDANDPDSVAIKWNLAQNYYVALALGLDSSGALLGEDLFGTCTLYLDTNVVIQGLEASAPQHESFRALVRACKRMGVSIRVWGGTLRELNRVMDFHIEAIEKAADRIPVETESKIRGIFYEMYRKELRRRTGEIDVADLFSSFSEARTELHTEYGIKVEDDSVDAESQREKRLANDIDSIMETYTRRRGRQKSRLSAIHDATLIEKASENTRYPNRCLVVTLDRIMPAIRLSGHPDALVTIALDAFLQWISPFASGEQTDDELPEVFSRALASRILPDENLFDIRDFLVFAAIDYNTKALPARDVESCIFHLRKVAPELNPLVPKDRERIHGEIARFFADPGREFHKTVKFMEDKIEEAETTAAESEKSLHEELEGSKKRADKLQIDLDEERKRSNKETEDRALQDLQRSTRARLGLLLILWGVQLLMVVVGALLWGSGDNFYQLILHSWPALAATPVSTYFLSFVVLGKKRRAMVRAILREILGR